MIAEELAGKRIAITGSTGFVGTALVERLLRGVPECELILLVYTRPLWDAVMLPLMAGISLLCLLGVWMGWRRLRRRERSPHR